MLNYLIRRIVIIIPLLWLISVVTFIIITLPPGDYMTTYIANLRRSGTQVTEEEIINIKHRYGLDRSLPEQYFIWIKNIVLEGDFGRSFSFNDKVVNLLGERIVYTMVISLLSAVFVTIASLAIGIYSALNQYTFFDYFWNFISYFGMATPSFLLALVLAFIAYKYFDANVIGLFSKEYSNAVWSFGKVVDLLKHMIVPVLIIGVSGTAGSIQINRGLLLDELNQQYVITARAKGLPERQLIFKYPVRVVLNPMMSTIGWMLPGLVSGEVLVSMVLNIPSTGPLLLTALLSQDMYLAGSILFILSVLTLIGTLVSDIALAWIDPRIRFSGTSK
jgi:peptide/nickel transport system permease protein